MNKAYYFFLGLFICLACNDGEGDEALLDLGYDYFPVRVGTYVEYKADSIWHDQPDPQIEGIHDTSSYFIREVIESEIIDAEGDQSLRIERFKRSNEIDDWDLVDIWFSKRTAESAEKVEENVRYIKMAFPLSESANWDINALNTNDEWPASYDSLFVERTMGSLYFAKTVRVFQRDFSTLIDDELAYEIYAEGVGLVERYEKDLNTQLNYVNNPVAANIQSGHEFKWKVIDYGIE